jgi:hypothetical protein
VARAVRVRQPWARARWMLASKSVVFPIPGSPSMTTALAPLVRSSSRTSTTAASSPSLPRISDTASLLSRRRCYFEASTSLKQARLTVRVSSRLVDSRPERDEQFSLHRRCPSFDATTRGERIDLLIRDSRRQDGAFMEPSGRNPWQPVESGGTPKTALTSQNRCHGLRPVADRSAW